MNNSTHIARWVVEASIRTHLYYESLHLLCSPEILANLRKSSVTEKEFAK